MEGLGVVYEQEDHQLDEEEHQSRGEQQHGEKNVRAAHNDEDGELPTDKNATNNTTGNVTQEHEQTSGYGNNYGAPEGNNGGQHAGNPNTQWKLFVGGVSWETTEDGLREHFGKYGTLLDAALMKDKYSGQPRGFGFVTFEESAGTCI